ncbi:ATP-grasp domain-containing protein [Paenibacillus sp. W2I17]|uniref:ATP-grasp domain-containing protein n=1 Tax=Paenibacillus sp. W2I17 TaxID=3042311 RepID=UPI00278A919D|nr:ATP-grasp domain-containing protein [Paenibacillus sp. W2I17]MDQ0656848.1 D-alanine-D-alanine ligase [Paenibacillus sp. W2I17]
MNEIENLIKNLRSVAAQLKLKYHISLLSNTRSNTRELNNSVISYSTNNEFFNDKEFDEVFEGIKDADFFVETFFNEIEFILEVLKQSYFKNKRFVYNLSRNGQHIGKKSLIPSFCDLMSIPYTGSDALVISFSRAKYIYTKYLEVHNVKVPDSWVYDPSNGWLAGNKPKLDTKIIIKPMHESASIGLSETSIKLFDSSTELKIINDSKEKNSAILVQQFIEGYECEVPLLISSRPYALNPIGISINGENHLKQSILTSDCSFNDGYNFYSLDKELSCSVIEKVRETAIDIAQLVGLRSYGRVDFRIDNQGDAYLMDIAASPYTTKHSSFAYAYNQLGLEYHEIYSSIIGLSSKTVY